VKFSVRMLMFGQSAAAAAGIEDLVGMDEDERADAIHEAGGDILKALTREVHAHCAQEHQANWKYIVDGVACEESSIPTHVKADAKRGTYHGGTGFELTHYDENHKGMRLDDFTKLESCKLAKLKKHHVAVLRLYTTSSFRELNGPLRNEMKPHPLALTVYYLCEAIKKLRVVRAKVDAQEFNSEVVLWRGLSNATLDIKKFKEVGGTELAPMSTTMSVDIANKYSDSASPLILRYKTSGLNTGVCLQFLSVYPKEQEYLYPPGTFLQFEKEETDADGRRIITIRPTMP